MSNTAFVPSKHGWPFANSFRFRLQAGPLDLSLDTFGYCGGMSRLAVSRYFRGETIDRKRALPPEDDELFGELRAEQITAMLADDVWTKVCDWTKRPTEPGHPADLPSIATLVQQEQVPRLIGLLEHGFPVVICLIRAEAGAPPTDNQMVVARGFELQDDKVVVSIYDPNHPDDDKVTLSFAFAPRYVSAQSTGEASRGFFIIPQYGLRRPGEGGGVWVAADAPPQDAWVGGNRKGGPPVYIGRARHRGNYHPGKVLFLDGRWSCFIADGTNGFRYDRYEVFLGTAQQFRWAPGLPDALPENAVLGGHRPGQPPLYVGRAEHEKQMHPAKVARVGGRWSCFFGYEGTGIRSETFEVLCRS